MGGDENPFDYTLDKVKNNYQVKAYLANLRYFSSNKTGASQDKCSFLRLARLVLDGGKGAKMHGKQEHLYDNNKRIMPRVDLEGGLHCHRRWGAGLYTATKSSKASIIPFINKLDN